MLVENAFGILASRWTIFHCRIYLLVVAVCILYNVLLAPSKNYRLLDEEELLGRHMAPVRNMGGNWASGACNVREIFCTFFNTPEGSVSRQDRIP